MIHDEILHRRAELSAECETLRKLWRAVLVQALKEAHGNILNTGGKYAPHTRRAIQRTARDWIGSRDFREVCELAGVILNPRDVLARIDGPLGAHLNKQERPKK